ncbi:MAG: hypothetical protein ABSH51_07170 [Solirubrobacteraceae bacterium]|jgi:hypothetical protein
MPLLLQTLDPASELPELVALRDRQPVITLATLELIALDPGCAATAR